MVLQFHRSSVPRVVVELPGGEARCIPLSWTDRALPSVATEAGRSGQRLWCGALLDVVALLEQWRAESRNSRSRKRK